jgi:tetratricopeptide (TPR) repeat protein
MADVLNEIRALKERAMLSRDIDDFDDALAALNEAEKLIMDELAQLDPSESGPGRYQQSITKQLYHIRGAKGGVYRRMQRWNDAVKAYDRGYAIESAFEDSYNLTQRLVTRVLADPASAETPGTEVEGLDVQKELAAAADTIRRQMSATRERDEYAAADLLTVTLLLDQPDWRRHLQTFLTIAAPSSYAREATRTVFNELAGRVPGHTALGARLSEAMGQIGRP